MAWPSSGSYTAWSACFKVTSQASKISAALDGYFLDLALMPSAFWSAVQSDGDDLRFTEDDGETSVSHQLIYINVGATAGLVWVAQPHGSGGASSDIDTYCYVGNAGATSTSTSAGYPSTLEALWMLQEAPTSSTAIVDWSGNGNGSTSIAGSMTSGDLIAGGPFAGLQCVDFDNNDRISFPSTVFDGPEAAGAFTFFSWFRPNKDVNDYGLFGAAGSQFRVLFQTTVSYSTLLAIMRNSANTTNFTTSASSDNVAKNLWHLAHVTWDGATLRAYINGAMIGSVAATSLRSASLNFYLGSDNATYLEGRIGPTGIYSSAFSSDQCATQYNNEAGTGFWVIEEVTGETGVSAGGTISLGGLTLSGSAEVPRTAGGTISLGGLTLSGMAEVPREAGGTITLGGLTLSGLVEVEAVAGGTINLGGLTLSGLATVETGDATAGGTINLGGLTLSGVSISGDYSPITADGLGWYLTGADGDGVSQRDPALSLGGYRSGRAARVMTWDMMDPMMGVEILALGGGNGRGAGLLTAVTEDSLSWTPPGGAAGVAVSLPVNGEATLYGFGGGSWIRVRRRSTLPLVGGHVVKCLDLMNNVIGFGDVASADAVAGETYYRAVIGRNDTESWMAGVRIWVDAEVSGLALAHEALVDGALQTVVNETTAPTGVTWVTGTTRETGLVLGAYGPGQGFGLWLRRTIGADSAPSHDVLNHIHVEMTDYGVTLLEALRGRYKIARTDYEGYGLWVGVDGPPDFDAAPDEIFTSLPHTTSLGLSPGRYEGVVQWRNKWGLWSGGQATTPLVLDVDDSEGFRRPTAPTDLSISQTADNKAVVGAFYEPALDGTPESADRARMFVVWLTTDGTVPDPADPPTGYKVMGTRAGIEVLRFQDSNELLDGTPVQALVRTRRLALLGGTRFRPDVTQLPASGAGTIVVSQELTGWDASGYAEIRNANDTLQEVIEYSALVVGAGISTFTVGSGGRGLWGTSAAATTASVEVRPVSPVDSENTTPATGEIDGLAPMRPWGEVLSGALAGLEQVPVAGPDGVTPNYIDEAENIYTLSGEGWSELWMDTVLVWRVVQDVNNAEMNRVYVPSEFDLVAEAVSGAGSGVFEAASGTVLYLCAGGVRRVKVDTTAMTISSLEFSVLGGLPEVAPQSTTWEQYSGSLLQVWDPGREDWRPWARVGVDGQFTMAWTLDNSRSQSVITGV